MEKKKEVVEINTIEPTSKCINFVEKSSGIFFASEDDFRDGHTILKPETYSLAKWLKQNKPEWQIKIDSCETSIDLKSVEIWLPLIFLAHDVTLPLFLSATYDYLKWRIRGALSKEVPTVHMRVISKIKKDYKEFRYDGPVTGLDKIKKFDINKFMNE